MLRISDASEETASLVRWANDLENRVDSIQNVRIPTNEAAIATTDEAVGEINGDVSVPPEVQSASVTQQVVVTDGTVLTQFNISYTAPNPLSNFAGIFLVITGYQGNTNPVKVGEDNFFGVAGGTGTTTVQLSRTGESVTVYFVAKNFLGITRDVWTQAPVSLALVLDGSTSNQGIVVTDYQLLNPLFGWISGSAVNSLPFPGWGADAGVTEAYETGAGTFIPNVQDAKLTVTSASTGIYNLRHFAAVPGTTFSSRIFAKVDSGTATLAIKFFDKDNAVLQTDTVSTTSATWVTLGQNSLAPANSIYATYSLWGSAVSVVYFQSGVFQRVSDGLGLTPANNSCIVVGSSPLTQHLTSTQIDVAASTFQCPDKQVSFNSGTTDPGSLGTYYVYADDPTYKGGATTYSTASASSVLFASNFRFYFGKITTVGGGGGTGSGGGSGGGRGTL